MTGPRPLVDNLVRQELGPALVVARKRFIAATTSPRFLADCATRYEIGQREYAYEYRWLEWPEATYDGEILTEILDVAIYEAMRRTTGILREAGWRR